MSEHRACRQSMLAAFVAVFAGVYHSTTPEANAIPERPPPVVVAPDFTVLPANHLKFYLHFASPMERGDVFRHLRLVEIDEEGKEIEAVVEPFREVELWDESFTRLTLWLHPGRQKPGVNLNVEMGPVLRHGRRYQLEILKGWETEGGAALEQTIRHRFSAGQPDLDRPSPKNWKVHAKERIVHIATGERLDPVSAASSLSVRDRGSTKTLPVRCVSSSREHSTLLTLSLEPPAGSPLLRWPAGTYELIVAPKLEDLAGNSLARPFNLDLEKFPDFKERTEPVVIPFTIPEDSPGEAP